jgi:hypothetical protein
MQSPFHNGVPVETGLTRRKEYAYKFRTEFTSVNRLPTSRQFSGESALEIVSYRFGTSLVRF